MTLRRTLCAALALVASATGAAADPCGMVPPITVTAADAITRVGPQKTYVFHKDGIETFVIRPGFNGKVEQFGMLIPFPSPPSLRKVPDALFTHLAKAIDPPEVVVDLRPPPPPAPGGPQFGGARGGGGGLRLRKDQVRVLRTEAVGMYEVAVLDAGSAAALKRWMDDHGYRYPTGMDKVCEDYVKARWCFVAVKTKVAAKASADPRAGMKTANPKLPKGASFDGHVQGMGFRFRSERLVVPMRLSAFNAGRLRNVVYLLTDKPSKIAKLPASLVRRQIDGKTLIKNMTQPLRLRVLGGTVKDIPAQRWDRIRKQRDPAPHNGLARELFAGDLLTARTKALSHPFEEAEKTLLRVGEALRLRNGLDPLHHKALAAERDRLLKGALDALAPMTLTVIDGDFPRELIAAENLTFEPFTMPTARNNPASYDATKLGPGTARQPRGPRRGAAVDTRGTGVLVALGLALVGLALLAGRRRRQGAVAALALMLALPAALADPCGMVPPITVTAADAITRVGPQKTYVFHKDGVETFVIRPGFNGKVEEFGMLIPFPSPPELRKVPDALFAHIAKAVDPPEVVIDLNPRPTVAFASRSLRGGMAPKDSKNKLEEHQVRILKQEAVGMYEVAVLDAGSAKALSRWMTDHGYRYPKGMDTVCNEYISARWCFVAIKTKVAGKAGADPRPGMKVANPRLPKGASFDGHVQGMGFRFRSKELVVPMRLSAFNAGRLRNVVYLLTDAPSKIAKLPETLVRRQVDGKTLLKNLTELLPLRLIGGTVKDIAPARWTQIQRQRDPVPHNGLARELFAGDMLAATSGTLSHPHEEAEKMLLRIGEALRLRNDLDGLHHAALAARRDATLAGALKELETMTLTVIDGDFPREVLAADNLHFERYAMPQAANHPGRYDATRLGPGAPRQLNPGPRRGSAMTRETFGLIGAGLVALGLLLVAGIRRGAVAALVLVLALGLTSGAAAQDADSKVDWKAMIAQLGDPKQADKAVDAFVAQGAKAVPHLLGEALEGPDVARRGWAIVCLTRIGGPKAKARLAELARDGKQLALVRTWAAAGRIKLSTTMDDLAQQAPLLNQLAALKRPLGMRAVELAKGATSGAGLLALASQHNQFRQALTPVIMNLEPEALTEAMVSGPDNNIRRLAAGYLAAMAQQGKPVGKATLKIYSFDAKAKELPWKGGALFVPSIKWERETARELVHNLMAWFVWTELNNQKGVQKQLHNNLRSLSLARMAGYRSPGWNQASLDTWLAIWGKTIGHARLQKLLEKQNVADQPRFKKILDALPK